jgi:uncharacterized membrane protein
MLSSATDVASSTARRHPETLLAAAGPAAVLVLAGFRARHRLPIQCCVDVAVPLEVVYDEWMRLAFLPEGPHDVERIERVDDGRLCGQINAGLRHIDWEAEVLDDRDCESFAWRSTTGSDCAGLITFHQLSDRLTRLELQLDVMPVNLRDTMALALQIADHRAEAGLRGFKSRLETISPDVYGELHDSDQTEDESQETDEDSDHTDQTEEER